MIKTLNYARLSNHLLFTFVKRLLALFGLISAPETSSAKLFIDKTTKAFEDFSKAFENNIADPFTVLKAEKDDERDEAYLAFRTYIEACSHRLDETIRRHADTILRVIKKHGWSVWSKGYKHQTAVHSTMFADIRNNYKDSIDALQAGIWQEDAEQTQRNFEEVTSDSFKQPEGPSLSELRPALIKSLRSLLNMTQLILESDPTDENQKLVAEINELIGNTMTSVKASNTRKNSQNEDEASTEAQSN